MVLNIKKKACIYVNLCIESRYCTDVSDCDDKVTLDACTYTNRASLQSTFFSQGSMQDTNDISATALMFSIHIWGLHTMSPPVVKLTVFRV